MSSPDTFCGGCGQPILDEHPSGDPANRKPCPKCGSLTRQFAMEARATVHVTASAELSVTTYPQTLLATAENLLQQDQYGISIVVAHMACEVATERASSEAFRANGVEHLEEPVLSYINGFNLANERNQRLYTALSGDPIQTQAFWPNFKVSAIRRNAIMHRSKIVNRAEAEESLVACKAFVGHLGK